MHFLPLITFPLAALTAAVQAQRTPADEASEACKSISQAMKETPRPSTTNINKTTDTGPVSQRSRLLLGRTVQDCLESIPFDRERTAAFIPELKKYVEFQSTLEILKNPPASWPFEAVDVLGRLDGLGTDFKSQYEFDLAIDNLAVSAHDSHFNVLGCSLRIFSFQRDHPGIIAVSKDGLALPEIYSVTDAAKLANDQADDVSPIETINGQDVLGYLEKIAINSSSQSPDSQWNELFANPEWLASPAVPNRGRFVNNRRRWPGTDNTTITFKNGSSIDASTLARLNGKKKFNSTTPAEVFERYCVPKGPPPPPSTKEGQDPDPEGFPKPFARDPLNQMMGYNLDDETAVMKVASFGGHEKAKDYAMLIKNLTDEIIDTAKASGRTKMIIDVSGNPGGEIQRYRTLFKAFFPDLFPFEPRRLRRSDQVEAMVQAFSTLNQSASERTPLSAAHKALTTPDEKIRYNTSEEFLGDTEMEGQLVTSPFTFLSVRAPANPPVRGFGDGAKNGLTIDERPFKVQDLLIIGNGFCHSSCAGFVNLMANQGGVKTMTFGGRHQLKDMDIIGGTRGGQIAFFPVLSSLSEAASKILRNTTSEVSLSSSEREKAADSLPKPLQNLTLNTFGTVNFQSMYASDGTDGSTLQFQNQPSDCRRFFTAQNILDPKSIWKDAQEAFWGGGQCFGPGGNSTDQA
ncbi:hypothetical protein XA68_11783 [Ophiocordyceps unilateralis]|uniref:CPAF-like PDZ domain-containing protein n=1 Tax=Ophiocordyceps unilateralis TaxID=268505 RepID=A0A2A9PF38_OPHUN|nr:hypothetical protein XA68_11783 [Ophiocordyceps unilateralis]